MSKRATPVEEVDPEYLTTMAPAPRSPRGYQLCWYCAELAQSRDHLKPRAMSGRNLSITVPACIDCNSRLGDYPRTTDRERGQRVAVLLLRKLASTPKPKWTVDEAADCLEGNALGMVLSLISRHNRLSRRCAFACARWHIPLDIELFSDEGTASLE